MAIRPDVAFRKCSTPSAISSLYRERRVMWPLTKVCGSILKFAAELIFSGVTKTGTILSFNFKFCAV